MGLLAKEDSLLMIKHTGIGEKGHLWTPPGGGVEFGHSAEENLKREFREETGLEVAVNEFLFVNELVQPPLHAIELFFTVTLIQGNLIRGTDPEMSKQDQIINEVRFMSWKELRLLPLPTIHKAFHNAADYNDLAKRRGYYRI